jgi:predicted nucleic acid-binding protein
MFAALAHPVQPGAVDFVLDCGVAFTWCVSSVMDVYSPEVLNRMATGVAAVPPHWYAQLAERLREAVRTHRVARAHALHILAGLNSFAIRVDHTADDSMANATFALAEVHKLTVFDAAYLELALRLAVPLATTHPDLTRAATAAGVPLFTP